MRRSLCRGNSLLQRLFGDEAANALRAPYVLGNKIDLQALFAEAGLTHVEITTQTKLARFPSIEAWAYTDIKGWTLADMIDEAQYERLLQEAEIALRPFVTAQGTVAFDAPAHIVAATKPVT